ncbi:serine/threonine-protein phosphatase 4 regulatory subunit 2-B [Periophthalmus magnuspinnatus]|uniref:serine/threonine-protein phosphatase 4 regulatory subunit 2-B n=1 Tax=Periophthalmus magnuspinnatus TaxID=409849 RepID=UPI00145B9495|nr:serine/threonine-protein phosphatase 4 regulatory subunit 2-B [Periophthalmus magnuspinnatus]
MEIDSLQEALRDFDKKSKKEPCPILEQFLCHVAKTGETMVQWSQFKNYFLFKLEKVMDDFRASAPEPRVPANANVESIPFDDMKERILKIVRGYNGIPFTIQRLCELLTEPKRNYTGTDKFLRGVEKNVMVVSCIHPTSEKNGCSAVNRMNGVMLPGNTSAFTERKVNGPGTPRPLNRPKVSLANSLAANGLPDSTDNKDLIEQGETENSSVSGSEEPLEGPLKTKHPHTEEDMEAEQQEVKRLKFCKDEDEEDDDEDEEDEPEVDSQRPSHSLGLSKEAEAMVQDGEEKEDYSKDKEASSATTEDQEPSSSTQSEACAADASPGQDAEAAEREVPCGSQDEASDMDQTEQQAPAGVLESPESSHDSEEGSSDPVSSSSSSSSASSCSIEESTEAAREDVTLTPSSSTSDAPTDTAMESTTSNTGTTEEPMEQD